MSEVVSVTVPKRVWIVLTIATLFSIGLCLFADASLKTSVGVVLMIDALCGGIAALPDEAWK